MREQQVRVVNSGWFFKIIVVVLLVDILGTFAIVIELLKQILEAVGG